MSDLIPANSILMRTVIWSALQNIADFIFLLIYMLMTKKNIVTVFKKVEWRFGILITISMSITHLLVLSSMFFVRDVSYVAAFRQISIPMGALLGFIFLKEKPYRYRIIGVTTIFIGLVSVVLT